MRKHLLTSAAVLALSASAAFASDLPTHKAPPPPPPPAPFSWTGFYIGAEGGFGWGQENDNFSSLPIGIPADSFNVSGPIGGVKAGYDQQFNSLVIGVVADIEASGIHGGKSYSAIVTEGISAGSLSMHNTWQSSLRARAGVAFDRLLIYGTGGVAFANDQETAYYAYTPNLSNGPSWSGSQTRTLVGWTVGAGAEYAFDNHWSASAELRYANFGRGSYSVTGSGEVFNYKAGFDETLAQVGLSYKF
jgi:outer membrane immunogenic protein